MVADADLVLFHPIHRQIKPTGTDILLLLIGNRSGLRKDLKAIPSDQQADTTCFRYAKYPSKAAVDHDSVPC